MQIFHFRNFFFSVLKDFSGKTYERTCRFYKHFQSTIRIGRVYQVLPSGYFFPKFDGHLNLMATFFAFPPFYEKTYEKTCNFYDLFSNILS